jgi:hypothetical protein
MGLVARNDLNAIQRVGLEDDSIAAALRQILTPFRYSRPRQGSDAGITLSSIAETCPRALLAARE